MPERLTQGLDSAQGLDAPRRVDSSSEALRRRITYFMFFRLALLVMVALLAIYSIWLVDDHVSGPRDSLIWGTIVAGFVQTVAFAWRLRASNALDRRALRRLARAHTSFDVFLACAGVALTGGVESDFVLLLLVAVLGAATMGDRRQIVIAAGVCAAFFAAMSLAQLAGWMDLLHEPGKVPSPPTAGTLMLALMRAAAAIAAITALSSYLNTQLLSSVSRLGSLRTLTENIVSSLTSGLLTVDQQNRVVFANPIAGEILGLRGELAGRDCDDLIPGLSKHLEDSGGARNSFEIDIHRADDNRLIQLSLGCSPLLDEHGQFLGHVVNFQDVSKLREMERVLRRNERLAALGTLAASVAHEVRNPLAAIAGCAELLDSPSAGEEEQRMIRIIRRESKRLDRIVSELLDYTRPRKPQLASIDLGNAVRELFDAFRADPNLAEIEFVLDLPQDPVEARVDMAQLTQVLWNLIRNGAQAMDNVGRLEVALRAEGRHVNLQVRDRGCGIAPEDLERIFEPFYSNKSGGSGIGLALVQRIVEDHGGDIHVFSVVGEGTTVEVNLPR
ncbi:MAG: PAS domain-containing protein [Myxococcales bacterium]|nr:PAS domain-containing protein [Myxococcales bacterium]